MESVNYSAKAAALMIERGLFEGEPFSLLDVGCSGGIDRLWRIFGSQLHAHGFDPREDECLRLASLESNPNIHYHAVRIGLPEDDEWMRRKAQAEQTHWTYWQDVFRRSSARIHQSLFRQEPPSPPSVVTRSAEGASEPQSTSGPAVGKQGSPGPPKISVAQFAANEGLTNIDFIKIDTDGGDVEAVLSAESCIDSHDVLGFLVECQFQGSDLDTCNSFHNVDRIMKRHGFMIFSIQTLTISRAALPAPYIHHEFSETAFGQPVFGDVGFLRDPLWGVHGKPVDLTLTKLLKLISLYELFRVPDCAAELVLANRTRIAEVINPDDLLNCLTPPLGGMQLNYRDYVQAVAANPAGLLNDAVGFQEQALQHGDPPVVPGSVGEIRAACDESRVEPGPPARVTTPEGRWTYAAAVPLTIPADVAGQLWVRIRILVQRGEIGVGVLNRAGTAFQHRRFLSAGPDQQTAYLRIVNPHDAAQVIVENASPDGNPAELVLFETAVLNIGGADA